MTDAVVLGHHVRPPSEVTLDDVERERAVDVLGGADVREQVRLNIPVFRKILEHPLELLHGWRNPSLPQSHVWRSRDAQAPREAWWLVGDIETVPQQPLSAFTMQFIIGVMPQCPHDARLPGHFHMVPPRQVCGVEITARHSVPAGIVLLWGWTVPAEIRMIPW